jgi:ZIP family zinc transporter/zinc and cadmium transporter
MRIVLAIALGMTAAAADVAGGWLIVRRRWSREYLKYFVALGAGFMLATVFLEMIPESFRLREASGESLGFGVGAGVGAEVLILGGYLLVHFFEHTLAPHFHFGEEVHGNEASSGGAGYAALLGLVIHTFFDGVAIAAGLLISAWLGGVIFLAIFMHKFPEGFTVASLMLGTGRSIRVAFVASAILGASTLAGVGLMYVLRGQVSDAMPLSAGVTLYVAASDLIPEVNREPGITTVLVVFLGAAMMLGLKVLFQVQ